MNQGRKSESLQNERCENDAEREQQDEIAPGERLTIGEDKRDRQCTCERIRSAHPGPRDQRSLFPRSGIFTVERWTQQARQVRGSEHPNETNQHDQRNKHDRQPGDASHRARSEYVDNLRQLKPDEHEKYSVQNEGDHFPNWVHLQAHAPAQDARGAPSDVDARNYDSEDSGNMKLFAAEVGNVRRKQGEQCLNRRIVQTLLQLDYEPAHDEANADAAGGDKEKLQARLGQRKRAGHHGGYCKTERDKRTGVVDQAFSFEDDNDLARHAQILSDRQRRHGVGRRDDGAEYKTYRQRQSDQTVEQISSHGHR